ncbi:MAG: PH domain-containing protein [Pseudonocardiales bacterium]
MSDPLRRRIEPASRYLVPAERIAVNQRRHWSLIVPSFGVALLGLFAAGYVTGQMTEHRGPLYDVIWFAALALIGHFLYRLAEWNQDRFIVTDRRIMMVTGLLTRQVAMMPLLRVTDMSYERSVAGRIFGWGTFILESAGQDQALRTIDRLPSPDVLYSTVCALMFGESPHFAGPLAETMGEAALDETGPDA